MYITKIKLYEHVYVGHPVTDSHGVTKSKQFSTHSHGVTKSKQFSTHSQGVTKSY